nr:MAG TPA: hypothetical protein [Caudoviricetes sp.]
MHGSPVIFGAGDANERLGTSSEKRSIFYQKC